MDVVFEDRHSLPKLYFALKVEEKPVTLEVAQHIGNESVRCIAMNPTDGLMRGMNVIDTGAAISVPVGDKTLGRIFNVLGESIDDMEFDGTGVTYDPIHRSAPEFFRTGCRN